MKLIDLISGMHVLGTTGSLDLDVKDLVYDAGEATQGSCFFALRGLRRDGHDFVIEALNRGAAAVVSERPMDRGCDVPNVVVSDSRKALGHMSARMMGDPSRRLKVVGVTGTNGKTTTTYILESIFSAAGLRPGVIGTVEYRFAGRSEPSPHTTPFGLDLQKLLARMRDAGCASCAMEVSSHALEQERIAGCSFDAGIFTNLTPEHLDYHGEMESYFRAKAKLFERVLAEGGKSGAFAAINADAEYCEKIAARTIVPVVLYGMSEKAEVRGYDLSLGASGLSMRIATPSGDFACSSRLCGRFNAQNLLAATAAAHGLGIDIDVIKTGIESIRAVPGRFEPVENDRGIMALVDYAHTPDALGNALSHARELADKTGGRLIAVFGCGGDRDRIKRPVMGKIAAGLADISIVTSDNPRTEDPSAIIEEIIPGVKDESTPYDGSTGYEVIVDRRDAITRAVELSSDGDVLVVAGKGHEDYQIVGETKHHFDDREELARLLGKKR
ncbi:MAG: UDP-N-acetylmuramoyl-L-alanyl-D-glutamate--2,6-diaminopimelate ligase [bacterium]